jgi:soluble lytic murein transglycosylase-like protein
VTAPILRSGALQQALALTQVRPASPPNATFASALQRAQGKPTSVALAKSSPALEHIPAGVPQDVSGPVPYLSEIKAAANKYGVDPALLAAVVKQESNFNPKAQSGAGAKGLTQLMDTTARNLGVTNSFDPQQSLEGGAKFLSGLLKEFHGVESLALAAYNAGPIAVQKYGGIPPYQETQRYVPKVLGYAAQFRRIIAAA